MELDQNNTVTNKQDKKDEREVVAEQNGEEQNDEAQDGQ
jgi:hypothetical protein